MGVFSWKTQNTNKSISSTTHSPSHPKFTVYMVNPITGETFKEDDYEGYGVFGGKDYYELLAELNNLESDRNNGIDMALEGYPRKAKFFPILVEDPNTWKQFVGQEPENCEFQGYFYNDLIFGA